MVFSTQRLLVLIIILNVVMSLAYAIEQAPRQVSGNYGPFKEVIALGGDVATRTEGENSSVSPQNLQEEGSFGSALRMGMTIFSVFIKGLVALPFTSAGQFDDPLTGAAIWGLRLMWVVMYALIALEIFLIFKNRKTT